MTLNFYDLPWELNAEACPCDIHFNEYVNEYAIRDKSVFHLGTGAHHIVGINNSKLDLPNSILGITASKSEYEAYMDLVTEDSRLACSYKVIFADIYSLSEKILPTFDMVTLFHLGEFWIGSGQGMHGEPAPDTPLDVEQLLGLFLGKLNPGGRLVFYRKSAGWDRIETVLERAMTRGDMIKAGEYKTLRFFKRLEKNRGKLRRWMRALAKED